MNTKTAPTHLPGPPIPNYTSLNTPRSRSIAAVLNDLAPELKPPGVMAVLLGIPITPPLTAGQRARAQHKPRVPVRTLNILLDKQATVEVITHWLTTQLKPYTRIRMTPKGQRLLWGDAHHSPETRSLMPTPNFFRGVPVVLFTEEALHKRLHPAPRAKKATRAPRKQPSAEERRAASAKARNTCPIQLTAPSSMTLATVEEIVNNGRRGRLLPFSGITMSEQCRDKLWAQAQEYTHTYYAPHPLMPAIDQFMGLPLRTVAPRESWGSGRDRRVADWHNVALHMEGHSDASTTPYVPYYDPDCNVAAYGTPHISVAWLYAEITRVRAKLREEGQQAIRVEAQVTPVQLRRLQRDPRYPHSQGWPLAYAYPGVPHPTKTYFYGVLVRSVEWVHETATNNKT